MALVLGVTGGIGSGKSTVLRILGELGAVTLSADDVAREVLAKGSPAYDEAVGRFGAGITGADGEVDRAGLAKAIFADADARAALNEITHPRIIGIVTDRIERFRKNSTSTDKVLAVEIPLLFECGMRDCVDQVLLVAAEQQTQVGRLTRRSGISPSEAVRRIGAQMPLSEKIELSDWVIRNDGTLEALERSVADVWERARSPRRR